MAAGAGVGWRGGGAAGGGVGLRRGRRWACAVGGGRACAVGGGFTKDKGDVGVVGVIFAKLV